MQVESLGHIVLQVADLQRAKTFYHNLLGIPVSAESADWGMVFFTLGDHHNFAIIEVQPGDEAGSAGRGVEHFAFKLNGGLDALRAAKQELEDAGVEVMPVDHNVSYSLYFHDPDGNRLEVYVDGVEGWRENPDLILTDATALNL